MAELSAKQVAFFDEAQLRAREFDARSTRELREHLGRPTLWHRTLVVPNQTAELWIKVAESEGIWSQFDPFDDRECMLAFTALPEVRAACIADAENAGIVLEPDDLLVCGSFTMDVDEADPDQGWLLWVSYVVPDVIPFEGVVS